MNDASQEKVPELNPAQPIPRVKKKARGGAFRRKVKPVPAGAMLKEAENLLVTSRTRAQADGMSAADATDAFLAQIPVRRGMEILEELLGAETTIFDLNSNQLLTKPDNPTRYKAWETWVHMVYGKPVERKIIEQHNVDSMDDVEKKLASSPAMREQFKKMIAAAEAKSESGGTP